MLYIPSLCVGSLAIFSSFSVPAFASPAASSSQPRKLTLNKLKYVFAFGDSFTDVGYVPASPLQPRPENYEGNPPPPGNSSAYAPNHVQVLASELNKTFTSLYDLAHSGAVVDGALVDPYETEDNTFVHQVADKFLPYFSGGKLPHGDESLVAGGATGKKRQWNGDETLVVSWFGINDVDRAMGGYWPLDPLWEEKAPKMIESYIAGLEKVRKEGAQHFAILNLPPYWLSPSVQEYKNSTYTELAKTRSLLWNKILEQKYKQWQREKAVDAKIVDTLGLWMDMRKHPKKFGLSQVDTDCAAYIGGQKANGDLNYWDPSCPAPMKEYIWLDWVKLTDLAPDLDRP